MNEIRAGVAAVCVGVGIRFAQVAAIAPRSTEWWALEVIRWGLMVGAVWLLARALRALRLQVMEHEEKLATIQADALWRRLELDVVDLEDYTSKL